MANWLRQQDCPTLSEVVQGLDRYLCEAHPDFFGHTATHPILPLKPHKVIHDNLWGTVKFTWIECLLIDSPMEDDSGLEFRHVFPVDKWTQAYTSYSYNVRVFAFSEHREAVRVAARMAIEDVTVSRAMRFTNER